MNYLFGGDVVFGLNYGEVCVYMLIVFDFIVCCLNVGKFVMNLCFLM